MVNEVSGYGRVAGAGGVAVPTVRSAGAVPPSSNTRPVDKILDPVNFQIEVVKMVESLPDRIETSEELSPVVDKFSGMVDSLRGRNGGGGLTPAEMEAYLSNTFAKMPDVKLFAICLKWDEEHPEHISEIMTALSLATRSDPGVINGAPFSPDLYSAFSIISESDASITGVYNAIYPSRLIGRYSTGEGRSILGVTSYGVPPLMAFDYIVSGPGPVMETYSIPAIGGSRAAEQPAKEHFYGEKPSYFYDDNGRVVFGYPDAYYETENNGEKIKYYAGHGDRDKLDRLFDVCMGRTPEKE